jgi:hypothetical protein
MEAQMSSVTRMLAVLLIGCLLFDTTAFAIGSKNTGYKGGTAPGFDGAKDEVEGLLDTANANQLVFTATDKPFKGQTFAVPYNRIIDLEYGQKAGRRVGTAVATTIIFGPIGLLSLLSKKRNHYLTIGFKDESDKDQVVVLELGKDIVRTTIPIIEARSGKKVEYQDEESKNSAF